MAITSISITGANADAMGFATSTLRKPNYKVMGPDAFGLSIALASKAIYARLVSDACGFADSTQFTEIWRRSVTDAIGLSTLFTGKSNALRSVVDAIGFADSPSQKVNYFRSMEDSIGLVDSVGFQVTYLRVFEDSLGFLELLVQIDFGLAPTPIEGRVFTMLRRKTYVMPTRRKGHQMAKPGSVEFYVSQAPNATERYSVRMDPDLPPGATVAATGQSSEHTPPPEGDETTPTVDVSGNTVNANVGPLLTSGLHKVEVDVPYDNSNGIVQGVVFWITVP